MPGQGTQHVDLAVSDDVETGAYVRFEIFYIPRPGWKLPHRETAA